LHRLVALGLADNVADNTAQIGFELPQGPVGALKLFGVGVALMLDQGILAHLLIGLTQVHAVLASQSDQYLAGSVQKLGCAFRGSWALISRDGGQRIQAMVGRVSLTDVGY
jgi:hypothetical protein